MDFGREDTQLKEKAVHLSDQAVGSVMMLLQKALIEQTDVVEGMKRLDFVSVDGQLFVMNPPTFKFEDPEDTEEDHVFVTEE
jgi:hypothetical protein